MAAQRIHWGVLGVKVAITDIERRTKAAMVIVNQ
jgi:hypothetical protein